MYQASDTRHTTTAEICERIWLSIAEKKLRPGTRLKEEELSEVFDVSRARIRQVLSALESDGLVTIVANRGAFVAEPDINEARDVFHVRKQIEDRIIGHVIARVSNDEIMQLERHTAKEREAASRQDRSATIKLSGGFHLLLAELSGSTFLHGILHDLISRSSLISVIYRRTELHDCGPDEHVALIARIKARDFEGARAILHDHLQHIEDDLDLETEDTSLRDLRQVFG
ncbi:GntR family transcriptional regulator [Pseudorhodobacter sp.]|uniref:GntR family transcriptional regulator n=1 Tax=Pseudorhodobacter sp. TaxID=1934400 RepID=UPI0026485FFB|nr:GntR family transcriptional regulator [Pseudorhodobacter sp.]MDN5786791.1 GntR family transcriptional regulator [Pseudorhodobacter sp.]